MRKIKSNAENDSWQRIAAVMDHYRFSSISAFACHLGLNRAENLYQIKRGNNRISRALAEKISKSFPEVSKAWLLTGENRMLTAPLEPEEEVFLVLAVFKVPH